jgi:hypothetical protein
MNVKFSIETTNEFTERDWTILYILTFTNVEIGQILENLTVGIRTTVNFAQKWSIEL